MNRFRGVLVGAVLLLAATNAWAQATAQINGTVADSSGAVLPGVTVVAIQTDTGLRRETVTDAEGNYALLNLAIGPYRLEASLQGFRSFAQTGIVLQVNSNPVIKVTLQLGELAETLTVQGQAPLVETRNPAVGNVITNEQVDALPMEGRNVASLVVTVGAAVDTGNPSSRSLTQTRGIAIGGGSTFGVAYLLDGALHNNVYDGDNLPLPFPDAMQEFKVETGSQNAQNGYKAGGTASIATKGGTNAFHGDLFEFARDHRFNATSPFAAVNKKTGERFDDGLVRNQFGGVLGGPVLKDRIFFFGAYQGTRVKQTPADIITFIPTAAMLNGDFSTVASAQCRTQGNLALPAALGFTNNQINPALLSPAAVKISKMLPQTSDPCGQIAYSQTTKPIEQQPIGRVDVQLSQKHQLFGRYMLTTTKWDPAYVNANGNILAAASPAGGSGAGGRDNKQQSLVIGDTYVFTPNVVNSARMFVDRTQIIRTNADMFGPEDIGIKNMYSYIPHYMNITITGAFSVNTGTETYSFYKPNTTGLADDLSMVRGNHQYGFGAAMSWSGWNTQSNVRSMGPISFNGAVSGLPLADFLLGKVFEYRQAAPFVQDITQFYMGLYAQDTWRVSSKLTLNYGMRWEPWFPQESQDLSVYSFDINRMKAGTRSTVHPQAYPGLYYPGDPGFPTKAGMKRQWANVAPRVGAAWDLTGDGRTSVRAGFGLTSDFVTGQTFFDSRSAPPNGLEQRFTGATLDDPWGSVGRVNPFPVDFSNYPYNLALYSLYIQVPYDIKTTREAAWNLSIQRQLGDSTAVSATYLGNHMYNVWGIVDGNPAVVPPGVTPTGPCTLKTPGGGTQTFPNCSAAATQDLRRELSQLNPDVGQYFGYLDWVTDAGYQDYHGLLLNLTRRLSRGVSAGANYTVSKCEGLINQGQSPLNVATGYMIPVSMINPPSDAETKKTFEQDKGRCDSWRKHIFNVTASVESPRFTNTTARMLGSGWRLAGIFRGSSGAPLTIQAGADRALSGIQATTQRASQVSDNAYGDKSINNWFNASAFALPALGTYGNSPRNGYDGPGFKTVDLSLVRQFSLSGTQKVEARIEAFNAFNWFLLGNPGNNLSSATFGRITSFSTAASPRIMQFALRYLF
jgi:Carboxypeptidase regulatory-like domain